MTEHYLKFAPAAVRHYTRPEPPATLPITLNGHEICRAIFYDGRYSFYLPEKVEKMLKRGLIEMRFVFGDDIGRESWSCRPEADLIRIQVEAIENDMQKSTPNAPVRTENPVVEDNDILEL